MGERNLTKLRPGQETDKKIKDKLGIGGNILEGEFDRPCTTAIVWETNKYHEFKFLRGNRPISQDHVNKLKESIKKEDLEKPISVTPEKKIIDGQHLFKAREEMSLPIFYMVKSPKSEETALITTNKYVLKWKLIDYCYMHASRNNKHYNILIDLLNHNEQVTSLRIAALLCNPETKFTDKGDLPNGRFTVTSDYENRVAKFMEIKIGLEKRLRRVGRNYTLQRCIIYMIGRDDYDHRRMVNKLDAAVVTISRLNGREPNLQMLSEIYNYNSQKRVYFQQMQDKNNWR